MNPRPPSTTGLEGRHDPYRRPIPAAHALDCADTNTRRIDSVHLAANASELAAFVALQAAFPGGATTTPSTTTHGVRDGQIRRPSESSQGANYRNLERAPACRRWPCDWRNLGADGDSDALGVRSVRRT